MDFCLKVWHCYTLLIIIVTWFNSVWKLFWRWPFYNVVVYITVWHCAIILILYILIVLTFTTFNINQNTREVKNELFLIWTRQNHVQILGNFCLRQSDAHESIETWNVLNTLLNVTFEDQRLLLIQTVYLELADVCMYERSFFHEKNPNKQTNLELECRKRPRFHSPNHGKFIFNDRDSFSWFYRIYPPTDDRAVFGMV